MDFCERHTALSHPTYSYTSPVPPSTAPIGFTMPAATYNGLYDYQKTGVKWLWELHNQSCGGIIGDEMGLGKTVQVVSPVGPMSIIKTRPCHQNTVHFHAPH